MAEKTEKQPQRESRSVARWDPLAELEPFEGWPFRGEGWGSLREWGLAPRWRRLLEERAPVFAPAMDVGETDAAYVVTVEIPGASRDDVAVEVEEGMLTIRGEKKSEREEKKERRRWIERSYGSFTRSFRLPSDAQLDRIEAGFKDGVLTVTIPKAEARKPRAVAIKA